MSEKQNIPDGTTSLNRRKFVKLMGVTGMGVGSLGISDSAQAKLKRDITDLKGDECRQVLADVKSNSSVQSLQEKFAKDGWTLQFDEAMCLSVNSVEDESYRGAVVPFESAGNGTENSEQINMMWTDKNLSNDMRSVLVHQAVRIGKREISKTFVDWKISKYTVESGEVVSSSGFLSEDFYEEPDTDSEFSAEAILPPPNPGCGSKDGYDYCLHDITICENYNWSCLAYAALGVIGKVGGAAACFYTRTKLACGLFLNAIAEGIVSPDCPIGEDCSTVPRCVPCAPCTHPDVSCS